MPYIKFAVSFPPQLFSELEKLQVQKAMTRSELLRDALREYIASGKDSTIY